MSFVTESLYQEFAAEWSNILIADEDGVVQWVSPQIEKMFGYTNIVGEMVGMKVEALMPQRYREHHVELREAMLRHPESRALRGVDLYGLRSDGKEFRVAIELLFWKPEGQDRIFVGAKIVDLSFLGGANV